MPILQLPPSSAGTTERPWSRLIGQVTGYPWVGEPSVMQTPMERNVGAFADLIGPQWGQGVAPLRIGVLPGLEKTASRLTREGLRGPWFHGTKTPEGILSPQELTRFYEQVPESLQPFVSNDPASSSSQIIREAFSKLGYKPGTPGFRPDMIGSAYGTRLGEPAGVSLTRDLAVARKFGTPLRVGVDIPPSSVGDLLDPEVQRLLKASYEQAIKFPGEQEVFSGLPLGYESAGQFNQSMSDYLRSKGVEALRYNPRRWNEFELRVLDPKRAIPLGAIENPTEGVPWRYYYGEKAPKQSYASFQENPAGAYRMLQQWLEAAPRSPARLKDILGVTGSD